MITIDSKELDIDYTGFSERKIRFIKEAFVLFQHVKFPGTLDPKTPVTTHPVNANVLIAGEMLGYPRYMFRVVEGYNNSIEVKVFKDGHIPIVWLFLNAPTATKKRSFLVHHFDMSYEGLINDVL